MQYARVMAIIFHSGRNANVIFFTPEVALLWFLTVYCTPRSSRCYGTKVCSDLVSAQMFYVREQKEKTQTIRSKEQQKANQLSVDLAQHPSQRSFLAGLFYNKHDITITRHSMATSSHTFVLGIVREWKQNLLYLQQTLHAGRMAAFWRKVQCCFTCRIRTHYCTRHAQSHTAVPQSVQNWDTISWIEYNSSLRVKNDLPAVSVVRRLTPWARKTLRLFISPLLAARWSLHWGKENSSTTPN